MIRIGSLNKDSLKEAILQLKQQTPDPLSDADEEDRVDPLAYELVRILWSKKDDRYSMTRFNSDLIVEIYSKSILFRMYEHRQERFQKTFSATFSLENILFKMRVYAIYKDFILFWFFVANHATLLDNWSTRIPRSRTLKVSTCFFNYSKPHKTISVC